MDSEETLLALQDERSVMSFFVWPAAILISHFVLSDEKFGEDGFSPNLQTGESLVCHVDLDSLCMAPWDACRTLGTGSRPGIAIWRDVLCCISRLSRMPVFPVMGCLRSFRCLGRGMCSGLERWGVESPSLDAGR